MLKFGFSSQSNSDLSVTDEALEEWFGVCERGSSGDWATAEAESDSDSFWYAVSAPLFDGSCGGPEANVRAETLEADNWLRESPLVLEARGRLELNNFAPRICLAAPMYDSTLRPPTTPVPARLTEIGRRAMLSGFGASSG